MFFSLVRSIADHVTNLLTQQHLFVPILAPHQDCVGCIRRSRNAPLQMILVRYAIANSTRQDCHLFDCQVNNWFERNNP